MLVLNYSQALHLRSFFRLHAINFNWLVFVLSIKNKKFLIFFWNINFFFLYLTSTFDTTFAIIVVILQKGTLILIIRRTTTRIRIIIMVTKSHLHSLYVINWIHRLHIHSQVRLLYLRHQYLVRDRLVHTNKSSQISQYLFLH